MHRKKLISDWFNQYSHDIYNFLIYYTGQTDMEDLVQEVFIKALKGIDKFDGRASPKTWLFSIARNVAIDEMRKLKRKKINETVELTNDMLIIDQTTPFEILQENEAKKELYKLILSLKQNYRDVLILRGIKELTTKETAIILSWSEDKVKKTYSRALKALRLSRGGSINE
ncbi:RNA polymerase sigma factor [Bacillaceae bacterium W0354]